MYTDPTSNGWQQFLDRLKELWGKGLDATLNGWPTPTHAWRGAAKA